jgi:hypothetical protein
LAYVGGRQWPSYVLNKCERKENVNLSFGGKRHIIRC